MKYWGLAALTSILTAGAACAVDDQVEAPQLAQVVQQMSVCADGPTTYGIDVSRYQGDINWDLVAGSGVKFAFIQISRSLTDVDAKFDYNWRRAKEVGILRGAYQRFQPGMDVIGQAELFLSKLGPYQAGDLPPVLDVEDANGLTAPQIAERVRMWVDHVEGRLGVKPIIYTGYYFWKDSVAADFSAYPLWIANYSATCPLVPPSWQKWSIHQYSSTAMVPGITANTTDVNKFNGTLEQLQALARPPEPCPQIEPTEDGTVIDDGSTCFEAGGNPQFMRRENAGFGSSLQWTHATNAAVPSNFGRWNLDFAVAGRYRVEAFTPAPFNMSTQTVYKVRHGLSTTPVPVNQSAADGWNLIGEFDFEAGANDQFIRVDDNTGEPNDSNTKIVFDAVRLTLIPEVEPPSTGGCATGGGARGAAIFLLGILLIARRRTRR